MRRVWLSCWVVLGGMALAGCANPQYTGTIQGIYDDPFEPAVEIDGETVLVNPLGGPTYDFLLVSFVDRKSRAVTHRLDFWIEYRGPMAHFSFASDDTAKPLRVVKLERSRDCHAVRCQADESIGVILDADTLLARRGTGYAVKVSARDGSAVILQVTPGMIAKQLAAVDQVLASPAVAPASK